MSEFEELMNRLIELSGLPRADIENKITLKKEKIGAGYLTDQGAIFLVASDLGITLSEPVKKMNSEEAKTAKKISYQNDESKNTKVSKDDLENKFKNFHSIEKKRKTKQNIGSIMVMIGAFLPLLIIIVLDLPEEMIWVALGIMLVLMLSGSTIEGKHKKEIFSNQQKAFYNFYSVYDSCRKYVNLPNDEKTKKATLSTFKKFSRYVNLWTGRYAPDDISALPNSIIRNLQERIIPMINNNHLDGIQSFMNELYNFLKIIFEKEPTIEELKKFNVFLEHTFSQKKIVKEPSRVKIFIEKYPILKYSWIPPLAGGIVGMVLYYIDSTKIFEVVAYSLTIGAAIFVGVITISGKK